jgi:hypothetical protein
MRETPRSGFSGCAAAAAAHPASFPCWLYAHGLPIRSRRRRQAIIVSSHLRVCRVTEGRNLPLCSPYPNPRLPIAGRFNPNENRWTSGLLPTGHVPAHQDICCRYILEIRARLFGNRREEYTRHDILLDGRCMRACMATYAGF